MTQAKPREIVHHLLAGTSEDSLRDEVGDTWTLEAWKKMRTRDWSAQQLLKRQLQYKPTSMLSRRSYTQLIKAPFLACGTYRRKIVALGRQCSEALFETSETSDIMASYGV